MDSVVDVTDCVDVYPWADFSNLAFSTDPTIPAPNQGLGVAARVMATENYYVLGGKWMRAVGAPALATTHAEPVMSSA